MVGGSSQELDVLYALPFDDSNSYDALTPVSVGIGNTISGYEAFSTNARAIDGANVASLNGSALNISRRVNGVVTSVKTIDLGASCTAFRIARIGGMVYIVCWASDHLVLVEDVLGDETVTSLTPPLSATGVYGDMIDSEHLLMMFSSGSEDYESVYTKTSGTWSGNAASPTTYYTHEMEFDSQNVGHLLLVYDSGIYSVAMGSDGLTYTRITGGAVHLDNEIYGYAIITTKSDYDILIENTLVDITYDSGTTGMKILSDGTIFTYNGEAGNGYAVIRDGVQYDTEVSNASFTDSSTSIANAIIMICTVLDDNVNLRGRNQGVRFVQDTSQRNAEGVSYNGKAYLYADQIE